MTVNEVAQNAATCADITEKTEELTEQGASETVRASEQLSLQAQELKSLISSFKV